MRTNRGIDDGIGRQERINRDLWDAIEALQSEKRAGATEVTGDFTVKSGGRVLVEDGGEVVVEGGILQAIFIFLSTTMRPGRVEHKSTALGGEWTVATGSIDGGTAGGIDSTLPIHLATPTDDVRIDHATTSSTANAVLDATTKRLSRSTSSRRYKQNIEDATVDTAAFLAIRKRRWRDRAEVEADPDTTRRYVGAIAEELHDLGLTEFVEYDPAGKPDAIAYPRLTIGLLAVDQAQQAEIDALKQTVADLTARLDALTPPTIPAP